MQNYTIDENRNFLPAVTPEQFAELQALLNSVIATIRSRAGLILWWPNTIGSIPSGSAFLCNGQEVSRTGNPYLYSAIGDKYGAGDGSTTFNVPDLITTAENSSGNFIRATATDSEIGVKTKDQIRNIRGSVGLTGVEYQYATPNQDRGVFTTGSLTGDYWGGGHSNDREATTLSFNANMDMRSYGNNMAGHADGADIHPYNIRLVPIILTGNI